MVRIVRRVVQGTIKVATIRLRFKGAFIRALLVLN